MQKPTLSLSSSNMALSSEHQSSAKDGDLESVSGMDASSSSMAGDDNDEDDRLFIAPHPPQLLTTPLRPPPHVVIASPSASSSEKTDHDIPTPLSGYEADTEGGGGNISTVESTEHVLNQHNHHHHHHHIHNHHNHHHHLRYTDKQVNPASTNSVSESNDD